MVRTFLDDETRSRLAEHLASHQDERWGGFGDSVGQNSLSDTYNHVASLALLDCLGLIDDEHLVEYVANCQDRTGGFGRVPGTRPSATATHDAVAILALVGALGSVRTDTTAQWLSARQEVNASTSGNEIVDRLHALARGGFYDGEQPDRPRQTRIVRLRAAYHSLAALRLLGELDSDHVDRDLVTRYLVDEWGNNYFYERSSGAPSPKAKIVHTYFVVAALHMLDRLGDLPGDRRREIEQFLREAVPLLESDIHNQEATVSELAACTLALQLLGQDAPVETGFIGRLLSLDIEAPNYGFGGIGIAENRYEPAIAVGGAIGSASTFSGLSVLACLAGIAGCPEVGFPFEGSLTRERTFYTPRLGIAFYVEEVKLSAQCDDFVVAGVAQIDISVGDLATGQRRPYFKGQAVERHVGKLERVVDTARRQGIHLLVLPELSFAFEPAQQTEVLDGLRDRIGPMIVLGTAHDESGRHTSIMLSRDHTLLSEKINPAAGERGDIIGGQEFGTTRGERIQVVATTVGRLMPILCLDFIDDLHVMREVRRFIRNRAVDFVLNPQWNRAVDLFRVKGSELASRHPCFVLMANVAQYGGSAIYGQVTEPDRAALVEKGLVSREHEATRVFGSLVAEIPSSQEGILSARFDMGRKQIPRISAQAGGSPVSDLRLLSLAGAS